MKLYIQRAFYIAALVVMLGNFFWFSITSDTSAGIWAILGWLATDAIDKEMVK